MADGQEHWHNTFGGNATNVVQAGVIYGDVITHQKMPHPAQLPPPILTLVNQKRALTELDVWNVAIPDHGEPWVKPILGVRGSGKSTVAVYWMHANKDAFPDGQLCANLGAWSDAPRSPSDVLADFLRALEIPGAEIPSSLDARRGLFRSITKNKKMQILLEDVQTPAQVRALLPGPGRSIVLFTGHGDFSSLKVDGVAPIEVDPLSDEMATVLLRQYAGDRVASEPERLPELLRICDGLPVALCTVGALLHTVSELSIADLVAEIQAEDSGIARFAVGDQPTIDSLFDAVYRRLTEPARQCYRAIGVFPGHSDIPEAALRAVSGLKGLAFRAALHELITMRLVEQPVQGRLVVSTHVRGHAARLLATAERPECAERLLDWYVTGTVTASLAIAPNLDVRDLLYPDLKADRNHPAAKDPLGWLTAERAMLRDLVTMAHHGRPDIVVLLCVLLWSFYERGKHADDLLHTHELGLLDAERNPAAQALLLVRMGYAQRWRYEYAEGLSLSERGLELAIQSGNEPFIATALEGTGRAALDAGQQERAIDLLTQNLAIAERIGNQRRIAVACLHLAIASAPDRAIELLDRALTLFQGLAEPVNVAKCQYNQGLAHLERGDLPAAREALTEALNGFTAPYDLALVQEGFARLELRAGNPAEAAERYRAAEDTFLDDNFVLHAAVMATRLAEIS